MDKKENTEERASLTIKMGDGSKFIVGTKGDRDAVTYGGRDISSCVQRVQMDLMVGEIARAKVYMFPGKCELAGLDSEFISALKTDREKKLEKAANHILMMLDKPIVLKPDQYVPPEVGRMFHAVLSVLKDALKD